MKLQNKAFAFLITLFIVQGLAQPSFAEEVSEEPIAEDVSQVAEEDREKTWSVVDEGGNVVNAIICTDSVCGEDGSWAGKLPLNSECPGCKIVLQTEERVSGYFSTQDMDVQYNEETQDHTITQHFSNGENETISETKTLKTSGDIVDGPTTIKIKESKSIEAELSNGIVDSEENEVVVSLPEPIKRDLSYAGPRRVSGSLKADVQGIVETESVEESSGNVIVELAQRVVDFLNNIFRW